jgi:hypothetical protein
MAKKKTPARVPWTKEDVRALKTHSNRGPRSRRSPKP